MATLLWMRIPMIADARPSPALWLRDRRERPRRRAAKQRDEIAPSDMNHATDRPMMRAQRMDDSTL
jgi:hypothetical protein